MNYGDLLIGLLVLVVSICSTTLGLRQLITLLTEYATWLKHLIVVTYSWITSRLSFLRKRTEMREKH